MNGWWITSALALYIGVLFACAFLGERQSARFSARGRQWLYALTLGVYCTSWTFYGAVGSAVRDGWGFLPIYLGPLLFLWWGKDIWQRLVQIRARQSISSIADFIAARYGKSPVLASMVTVCAVVGILPYLALQLRAVDSSVTVLLGDALTQAHSDWSSLGVLILTAGLAGLAMLFGTRQMLANEHHGGLMLAVALESAVKLIALLAIGVYALWQLVDVNAAAFAPVRQLAMPDQLPSGFWAQTLLAALAMICLPRQFHVGVVECPDQAVVPAARKLFALYLLLTVLAILPIAAWALTRSQALADPDMAVLLLPLLHDQTALALLAFLGGFSASTGMMLVASVALSIMISNDLILPALWRIGWLKQDDPRLAQVVRWIRRVALIGLMLLGYLMYRLFDGTAQLASIGLLAFAAVAQFAPALIGGLYWRGGSKTGVMLGLSAGFVLWGFCLLLPALLHLGIGPADWQSDGMFGFGLLRPEALFGSHGLDPLTHGVLWSLSVNVLLYVGGSIQWRASVPEQMQALPFLQPEDQLDAPYLSKQHGPSRFRLNDLYALVERINGPAVAERRFAEFAAQQQEVLNLHQAADSRWWRMTEQCLAGAIGTASARRLLSTALHDQGIGVAEVAGLLDHASQWQRFNQALLATMMDHMSQGVSVVDADLRMVAWNRRYLELFDYPLDLVYVGCSVADLIRFNAERGECGTGTVQEHIDKRLYWMRLGNPHVFERVRKDGRVIEMRGQPIKGGGFVTTFADISDFRQTESLLAQRVTERTEQLEIALREQATARQLADTANQSKSRFVAAASHDLLQPMHAARLFAASLEHAGLNPDAQHLLQQLDRSLHGAESILSSLLDIARLDTGALQPHLEPIALGPLLADLESQYAPTAQQRQLVLKVYPSQIWVMSDAQWLRRMLQNLLSNALRYTASGRVVMGTRRGTDGSIRIGVWDTGMGIAPEQQRQIFDEFQRGQHASPWGEQGLGLGLAITLRMAKRLQHPLHLHSMLGQGSGFWLSVPIIQAPTQLMQAVPISSKPLDGLSVLCLDNDPVILAGMQQLLIRWGCQVQIASTLAEALRQHQAQPAHVWLIDQHLDAEQSGLQVLQDELPVGCAAALITADSDPDLPQQVRNLGAVFLKKPLQPAALRAFLSSVNVQRPA